jgi:hypothetical protein
MRSPSRATATTRLPWTAGIYASLSVTSLPEALFELRGPEDRHLIG